MRIMASICLVLLLAPPSERLSAEPFQQPPEGYTLVAEDNCGSFESAPHLVRGTEYLFPTSQVDSLLEYREIVFDDEFCLFRYKGVNPGASYKVDVVYVSQAEAVRIQRLEANGQVVHDDLAVPSSKPGRFLFDVPSQALGDGKQLDLRFINAQGANAVVCYLRLWSTDPRPLAGSGQLWTPNGPIETDWARQDRLRGKPNFHDWADPAAEVRDNVVPCLDELLQRGSTVLADLAALGADDLQASRLELAAVATARDRLLGENSSDSDAWLGVYLDARWAVRRLAFKNPLLKCDGLLFVRRHHPHAMHQCARRLGTFTLPGGGVCVLDEIRADGQGEIRCLTADRFGDGTFGRPDISFDGRRVVLGHACRRLEADSAGMAYGNISQVTAPLFAQHQVGPCHEFQVYEMGIDGGSPRQLTFGPSENSDPIYLPGGRIAFMSHRPGGLVQCGDWALAYCVFTMEADGGDLRQITVSKDGEWDPFLMDDGTIGFTRWEYVMKFWSPIQMLWSVRPDGTNPRLVYGSDLSRSYAYPLNYASARRIPGTGKLICVGSAHHNTGAGPLCVVDLRHGRDAARGLRRITPVQFVETPDSQPRAGWYDCPYPLGENYFLASYTFSSHETDTRGYAIYLVDAHGGKELIYRDPELSALFPMPIRPRIRPATVAATVDKFAGPADEPEEAFGEFLIQDVHEGLDPSARGRAKYLRIVATDERHIHTIPYAIEVGPDSGFETKRVLGVVPVESDGSAYFRLAAGESVFFSVLDENYQALHTMRSVTNIQAGERTGCVGCHEPTRKAPAVRPVLAAMRPASEIEPPPWGRVPMDYAALIQPVLDKHCVACHDGAHQPHKSFDLTASRRRPFMGVAMVESYFNLRTHVRHAPINQYFLAPGTFGSGVSGLTLTLGEGHYDVDLAPADWRLLCAWIDCNAPYIGDYEIVESKTAALEGR